MRQNSPRRPQGKPEAKVIAAAGDQLDLHLDLGMTVTVYCAETARHLAVRTAEEGFVPSDTGSGFTEH